jgi:hypothetical protein
VAAALYRISASGGASSAVTKLDEGRGELFHGLPYFLPDGKHFRYFARSTSGSGGAIYVASLDEPGSKLLLQATLNVAYAQGYLLFVREGTLLAQPFDPKRLEMVGDAFPVAEQIQRLPTRNSGVFSVSEQGVLAYQTGSANSGLQLTWFDRSGQPQGVLGDPAHYTSVHLSPDGKRAAVLISDPQTGNEEIWLYEVARGLRTRFTLDPAGVRTAAWSPDGSRIAFSSNRKGHFDIYVAPFPGPGGKRRVSTSGGRLPKWRGDGREIFYLAPGNKLMAAEVNGQGATLEVGAVRPLFEVRPGGSLNADDVTADGQRFLVNTAAEQQASAPITLVQNWTADLKR